MRSFIISAIIVCILIIIWYSFFSFLDSNVDRYLAQIEVLVKHIESDHWKEATKVQDKLYKNIEEHKKVYMFFLNHNELDDILNSIGKIERYIESKEKGLALAECATLNIHLEHILEKHSLTLVNIM